MFLQKSSNHLITVCNLEYISVLSCELCSMQRKTYIFSETDFVRFAYNFLYKVPQTRVILREISILQLSGFLKTIRVKLSLKDSLLGAKTILWKNHFTVTANWSFVNHWSRNHPLFYIGQKTGQKTQYLKC